MTTPLRMRLTDAERRALLNIVLAAEAACGELEWLELEPEKDRAALSKAIRTLSDKIQQEIAS